MSKLYLNGRLCNGNGFSQGEFKVPELRELAEHYNIPGSKKLNKEELCKAIIAHEEAHKALNVVPPVVVRKNSQVEPTVETPVVVRKNSVVQPTQPTEPKGG